MANNYAKEIRCKPVSAVHAAKVNFTDSLRDGALLTGTPTVLEVTTSDLTITNKAVNTAAMTINGNTAEIGTAVVASVSGGVAGTDYTIAVVAVTDETVPQTFAINYIMRVIPDS